MTVEIPIGMTTATIEITTLAEDPGVLEGDETLTVTLTHASTTAGTVRLGTPTTATTTIGDSDATVTVDVAAFDALTENGEEAVTVNEGEAQTFTVTLSGSVSEDVSRWRSQRWTETPPRAQTTRRKSRPWSSPQATE